MDPIFWWLLGPLLYLLVGVVCYIVVVVLDQLVAGATLAVSEMQRTRRVALLIIVGWLPLCIVLLIGSIGASIAFVCIWVDQHWLHPDSAHDNPTPSRHPTTSQPAPPPQ